MTQSKTLSIIESFTTVTVGICISFFGNLYILPYWGIQVDWSESAQITVLFACIGVVKNYLVRRMFTHLS